MKVNKHLNDYDIMQCLQCIDEKVSIKERFLSILKKQKNNAVLSSIIEHTLECQLCLKEIWDAYISLTYLQDPIKKDDYIVKTKLTLNHKLSSFKINIIEGLVNPINLSYLQPVLSITDIKDELSQAEYSIITPWLNNQPININIDFFNNNLSINLSSTNGSIIQKIFCYIDNSLIEKQTANTSTTTFIIPTTLLNDETTLSFDIEIDNKTQHKVFEIKF